MWTTVGLVLLVLAGGVLLLAALKPAEFRVERRVSINAPAASIHPLLDDFHRWEAWSPWEHIDATMQRTFSGAPSGPGAIYEWRGEGKAGAGRMEILAAPVPQRVTIRLDFIKPFASSNTTEFTLVPQGHVTEVQWIMRGPNAFVTRVMTVFVSMDQLVGKDFEAGLANLKAAAEGTKPVPVGG
ncbi:MAG TPA: SRPBCC family protein [Caldimonas sp.]|nr:SRPBCC family protein [Caldimonas sp.]